MVSGQKRLMCACALAVAAAIPAVAGSAAPRSSADTLDPGLSAISAKFVPEQRATEYSAAIKSAAKPAKGSWAWSLKPPPDNDTCNKFDGTADAKQGADASHWVVTALWHHSDADGCTHANGAEHNGTIALQVTLADEVCAASFVGTLDNIGPPADCTSSKNCVDELAAVARARAKLQALERANADLEKQLALLDNLARAANGKKTVAKLDALKAKAQSDPAAAKELAEVREAMKQLLADIFRLRGALDDLAEDIERAEQNLKEAQDKLAACQRGRSLETVVASPACEDETTALAAAQGQVDGYADVRRRVPKRLVTRLKAETTKTSAGIKSLVRVLPAAKRTAASLESPLTRATTGARRLDVWSKRLDASLGSAAKQVAAATSALDACRTSGG